MIWGCFSAVGVPQYFISKLRWALCIMSITYIQSCFDLLKEMKIKYEFMQDNDTKHSCKLPNKYFQKNEINVFEFAGLDPIAHFRAILKPRTRVC